VMVGGLVTSKKGINLPDSTLSVPAVTDYDWQCALWAIENELDFLAVSFVRRGEDILKLHARLRQVVNFEKTGTGLNAKNNDPMIPLVAKIETPQAVADIESIVEEADAIMVARGDLGVEMDLATLPVIQKRLVRTAHAHGKPCIVATQMLESMIASPTATRAEVSDVANAILDGCDAVMLSGETAVGKYPVLAVETIRRVALATEAALREAEVDAAPPERLRAKRELIPALAHGAWHMARDVGAKLIVVWAQHGGAARFLSRNSFNIPIIAFSSDYRSVRRMNILYATFPVHIQHVPQHRSDFARIVDQFALSMGWVRKGDPILLMGGKPLDHAASVNTVAIRYAGELAMT
jgi:pyruvate kinase